MIITQDELKKLLSYDPETGEFIWLCKKRKSNINGFAGTLAYRGGKKYIQLSINLKKYYAHRLAWFYVNGFWPKNEIDHINGNGCDNRIENLRCVDRVENCRNQRKRNDNKSGITGVCWDKKQNKWKSYINIYGIFKNIGHFDNLFDAACSRKSMQQYYLFHKNHGDNRPL